MATAMFPIFISFIVQFTDVNERVNKGEIVCEAWTKWNIRKKNIADTFLYELG